jgi:fucose permease
MTVVFWPSGTYRSFGGFCGSMFIVGSGLSTLETAANPFIATCGPPRYSEMRLTLAQGFQAIGKSSKNYTLFLLVLDSNQQPLTAKL